MANPFPGMNPYLESPAFQSEFHAKFITSWHEAILDGLPPDYDARIGEQVYLVGEDERRLIGPDVAVKQELPSAEGFGTTRFATATSTLEPVTIPIRILDEPRQLYVEIVHRPDQTLVAVLELLSPGNKENPGRRAYLTKRNAILQQQVHLVELDLLLGGRRLPMERVLPPGDYYYLVSRWEQRPDCQVYAWSLRHSLPVLPIPLRGADPDLLIDLGAVFATTFERGRYARRLRYDEPPVKRDPTEAAWNEDQVR